MKKLITAAIIVVAFVGILILNPFVQIEAGERGVVLTWGGFNGQIMEPGLHLRIPIAQSVVKLSVRTQTLEIENSESYSKDLQVVSIKSVLNYNLDPKAVGTVYQQYGEDYEVKILRPNLEAAVKQTIAKYSAEELLNRRGEAQSEIENTYKGAIPESFVVSKYALVNEAFSKAYEEAIEKKQIAQQDAERAENELKRIKIEAEQRVAQARAEAEAIKLQSDAANNDKYINLKALEVQLEAVKQWNGVLPTQMIPGTSLPFINVGK